MTETIMRGGPGLRSVKDMPMLQDGPPPGGFPSIRYGRRIPNTGPTGAAIFGVSALVISYGFYKVGQGNLKRRELRREKMNARATLVPILQAEEDRRYCAVRAASVRAEAAMMSHVPGWQAGASPYNTGRWMPPALSLRPSVANS